MVVRFVQVLDMIHDCVPQRHISTLFSLVVSTPVAFDSISYLQAPLPRYFPSLCKKVNGKAGARNASSAHPGDDKTSVREDEDTSKNLVGISAIPLSSTTSENDCTGINGSCLIYLSVCNKAGVRFSPS